MLNDIKQEFREFLSEEVKLSALTAKEIKYAVELAVEKNYSVSPIREITGNKKKLKITGKTIFSDKFIDLLIKELNSSLETNFVKESYEEFNGIISCKLILVNK